MSGENQVWHELFDFIMKSAANKAIGFPVTKILDLMVNIITQDLSSVEVKLDRHMSSPFREAEKILRYANVTQDKKEQKKLLEEAIYKFIKASENLTGIDSAKATLMVATLFDILGNYNAAQEAYNDAWKETKEAYQEKIRELDQKLETDSATLVAGMIGGAGLGTTITMLPLGVIFLIASAPAALSFLLISAIGAGVGGAGLGAFKLIDSHKKSSEYKQIKKIKNFKGLAIFDQFKNQSISPDIKLVSERKIDYNDLQTFLLAKKWKAADLETKRLFLELTDRELLHGLFPEDIEKIPCTDLYTVEQLWRKYSNGRFGFKVQKLTYQELGYSFDKLFEKVGWLTNNALSISYSKSAPTGHLPVSVNTLHVIRSRTVSAGINVSSDSYLSTELNKKTIKSFFDRIESCQILNR